MRLKNRLSHMKNGSVLVNGTTYEIDGAGITNVKESADIAKLLAGQSWDEFKAKTAEPKKPVVEPKPEPAPEPNPVEPEVEEPETPEPTAEPEPENTEPEAYSEEEGDELPDPTMDMTGAQLRKLADTYEISYKDQPTKKVLIERIMKAMYPKDDEE